MKLAARVDTVPNVVAVASHWSWKKKNVKVKIELGMQEVEQKNIVEHLSSARTDFRKEGDQVVDVEEHESSQIVVHNKTAAVLESSEDHINELEVGKVITAVLDKPKAVNECRHFSKMLGSKKTSMRWSKHFLKKFKIKEAFLYGTSEVEEILADACKLAG